MLNKLIVLALLFVNLFPLANRVSLIQQSNIQIQVSSLIIDFPKEANFHLRAASQVEINQVILVYGTNARSCLSGEARQEIDFDPQKTVSLDWKWDLTRSGSIPPGAEIWWRWEIQDSAGGRLVSDTSKYIVADPSFTWQTLQNGPVSLYWSTGDKNFGQTLINQAYASLDRLSKKAGISYPTAIKIYVYPTADDLKNATLHTPDWIGGIAYPEYDTTLMQVAPENIGWAKDVIPHELSHLVTDWRVYNCVGGYLPTWLSEGLARFAEGPLPQADLSVLYEAVKSKSVPSLTGLASGFAASSVIAENEYNYSGSVVTYLIDTFGADKMDALLGKIKEGEQIDPALEGIYGVNTAGLDRKWRASVGLSPLDESTPTTAPTRQRTQVPTMSLWTPVFQSPTATATPQLPDPIVFTPSPTAVIIQPTLTIASALPMTPTPLSTMNTSDSSSALPGILAGAAVLVIVLFVFLFLRKKVNQ